MNPAHLVLSLAAAAALIDELAPVAGGLPPAVAVAAVVLGLGTLAGVVLALRGHRAGMPLVVVTRVLDALSASPALASSEAAPAERLLAAFLVLVAVVVLLHLVRSRAAARAGAPAGARDGAEGRSDRVPR